MTMHPSMQKPEMLTTEDYHELTDFLARKFKVTRQHIVNGLNQGLVSCYSNYRSREGRFYPKVFFILWNVMTSGGTAMAKFDIVTRSVQGQLVLRKRVEWTKNVATDS